jgi:hypothetical protein
MFASNRLAGLKFERYRVAESSPRLPRGWQVGKLGRLFHGRIRICFENTIDLGSGFQCQLKGADCATVSK